MVILRILKDMGSDIAAASTTEVGKNIWLFVVVAVLFTSAVYLEEEYLVLSSLICWIFFVLATLANAIIHKNFPPKSVRNKIFQEFFGKNDFYDASEFDDESTGWD